MYASVPTTSPGHRERRVADHVGDAEVGELGEAGPRGRVGDDHDVLRLDVAVDHTALVRVPERVAERGADPRHVAIRDRIRAHELGKGSAPNELRDQIDLVLVVRELVHGHDAGMVEPGRRARLALDPLPAVVLARDRLDGHLALELLVPGQPDDPESARAETPLEAVATQHQPRARRAGQLLCRVRTAERQSAGLLGEAVLGAFHVRFRFRSAMGSSCPAVILP